MGNAKREEELGELQVGACLASVLQEEVAWGGDGKAAGEEGKKER